MSDRIHILGDTHFGNSESIDRHTQDYESLRGFLREWQEYIVQKREKAVAEQRAIITATQRRNEKHFDEELFKV